MSKPIGQPTSRRPTSAAMERYLRDEANYRCSVKGWSKPSSSFRSASQRLVENKSQSPDGPPLSIRQGTIADTVAKSARRPSSAFASKSPQRLPPERPKSAEIPLRLPQEKPSAVAGASFRSTTPRMQSGTQNLLDGQHKLSAPREERSRSRGAVGFLSNKPRLDPPRKPLCDAMYDVTNGRLASRRGTNKQAAWALSKSEQRSAPQQPQPVTLLNPRFATDISLAAKKHNTAKSSFYSVTPRFPIVKEETPAVGQYAPSYVSHGMLR